MYGYEPKVLVYSDNLSICSTETAAPTPSSSSDLTSVTTIVSSSSPINSATASLVATSKHQFFNMNSAFMPDDTARIATAGYASVDPSGATNGMLFDHSGHSHHTLASHSHVHQQEQEQEQIPDHSQLVELHGQQQQQQPQGVQMVKFSPTNESRTHTPAAKRSREDEESECGESESNSRGANDSGTVEKRSGRRKIKIEYIEDKSRRHITFSKRKAGIMKKAYELSTLTGTQVLLLVVSETGLVYTFTTPKLQPIVTQPEGKNLIQACLSVPDQPGERVSQPIPTESNTYMSQPRHSHNVNNAGVYANSAMAAAVAAASNAAAIGGAVHDLSAHQGGGNGGSGSGGGLTADDRKIGGGGGSPGAGVNHAATPYLQYQYGQSAVAQAVAAAASGGMPYGTLPGYASYPGSNSQSQHHSPIAAATPHTPQQQQQAAAAAAAATPIPAMNSLANYHHGYSNHTQQQQNHHQQQQQQQNHYSYHSSQQQGQYQQHPSQHNGVGSDGQSVSNPLSVTATMAAAVVAATTGGNGHTHGHQHQNAGGMSAVPYMTTNHYWTPAAGLASPHLPQPQSQQHQPQQTATGLIQRAGYGNSGN
ncbi:transcription factor of the MADS box [Coemansia spiralis]|uniref:Transcription factor of the MADS box n=1 Tax=Coemansia spiralis TaxID=417178 RepID=A0A9W8GBJ4_9FUNG|nr:transcription factor of the MADS box [Coemansia spiralis]